MLTAQQFTIISKALHDSVEQASRSLAQWLERPAVIAIESVKQIPLEEAAQILGEDESPVCCCVTELEGRIAGSLILTFDDDSGLALVDLLLAQPIGTATQWGELEKSGALETANIISCAYLNALARALPDDGRREHCLIPSPPSFRQDFVQSVLQAALVGQAIAGDELLLANAMFRIESTSLNWNLVFVPDATALTDLQRLLYRQEGPRTT